MKQSFDNRLINGMLYSLKTQTLIQSFMNIYAKLQQDLIRDFQIPSQLDQSYFYVPKDYHDFKDVMTLTPNQFLLSQYQSVNQDIYTKIWKVCSKIKEKIKKL